LAAEVVVLPHEPTRAIVYIARTPAAARALRGHERSILPGRGVRHLGPDELAAHRRLGAALGFPACCIDAYLARVARGVTTTAAGEHAHEDYVAAAEAAAASATLIPWVNMFPLGDAATWLSHVPCRFDCEASVTYAAGVSEAFARRDPAAAADIDRQLSRDVGILRDGARVELAGAPASACALPFSKYLDPRREQPVR
jgi:hypothetical protein